LLVGAGALGGAAVGLVVGRSLPGQVAAPAGAPTLVPPTAQPAATSTAPPPTAAPATAVPPTPAPQPSATPAPAATARPSGPPGQAPLQDPSPRRLPLWYGFNLQEKFNADWGVRRFDERDLAWIAELGFNFVRLPMDYRAWTEPGNWSALRQSVLEEIDQVLRWGEQYKLHVCLNFHRAPGYSVTPPEEPKSLWTNDEALAVCATHWSNFARRYKDVPSRQLSFNLLNEPPELDPAVHRRVIARLVDAVRQQDDKRLMICDGAAYGKAPPGELVGLNVAAATRGYEPMRLTHYQAEWIAESDRWPTPAYPAAATPEAARERDASRRAEVEPWQALQTRGMGVLVGEFGAYSRTPHAVTLAWMRERLTMWRDAGWGWALWNFRGPFGVIDSGRRDVTYERWRGAQLDRPMLELLRSFLPGGSEARS
jgi:endoglucanase